MTSIVARGVFTVSLAFDRLPPRTCRLGRRSSPTEALRVVTAAPSRVRLRLGVRRPRPPFRRESIAKTGHHGHTRHDRPGLVFMARSGASLEVSRPLQHTSAASRACSEGGRPPDLSRSGVLRSPLARASSATDLRWRSLRPCGFSLYRRGLCGVARSGGRVRVESCDSAFSHVPCVRRSLNEQDRVDSIPSSMVRRAGAVGETDSSHVFPARSRRTRRSSFSLTPP